MSVSASLEDPQVLVVRLSGKVTAQQFRAAQEEAYALLKPIVSVSVVVVLEGFEGWGPGDWDDSLIQFRHDTQIKRMAIVGDPKWEDTALLFVGKGLRHFDIEYCEPAVRGNPFAAFAYDESRSAALIPAQRRREAW